MKFLFDENISYRIVKQISNAVPQSIHISQSGLNKPPTDREIWSYAKANKFLIVTFDEDFLDLANVNGFPPKVILLRTGNSSTRFISELLINKLPDILQFYQTEVYGLLEIF